MRYSARAKIRRILAINSLFGLLLVFIYFSVGKGWDTTTFRVILALHGILFFSVVLDAVMVARYIRKINIFCGPPFEKLSFAYAFFFRGTSWKQYRELLVDAEQMLRSIKERASQFPELKNIREIIHANGAKGAIAIVEKAEAKAALDIVQEQDKKRREERSENRRVELLQKGLELGVPLKELQNLNIAHLRIAIADKKRSTWILQEAEKHSCVDLIQPLIQHGNLDAADRLVVRASMLIKRATAFNLDGEVRLYLAACDMEQAEHVVTEATTKSDFAKLVQRHEERINALPKEKQPGARRLLAELENTQQDPRLHRKAVHQLEQAMIIQ